MPKVVLKDFNLGGYSDSEYQGTTNSVQELVGFDIHSEPGVLKVNQAMKKEFTPDELIIAIVPCTDGNTYFFGGETGKIWKRTSSGTYSHVATSSDGGFMDAIEFNGYIYYTTVGYLGRWRVGYNWSTKNDIFGEFINQDEDFHPLFGLNLTLYAGDGNYVAVVEEDVFIPDGLDLPERFRIKSLGKVINDLTIGAFYGDNINKSEIFRWNTWSVSWSTSDEVPESGVNSFLATDNYVLVQAGRKGNLYVYTGEILQKQKRIPGDWKTGLAEIKQNATSNYFSLPLFGISNISGNPVKQGVYSYGGYAVNYPNVLTMEYPISSGDFDDITIGAIESIGDNILVSWKRGASYGIDTLDMTKKIATAYGKTRKISLDRVDKQSFGVNITWRSLPSGTNIKLYGDMNNTGFREIKLTHDTKRCVSYSRVNIEGGTTIKFMWEAISDGANNAPEIEDVIINLK